MALAPRHVWQCFRNYQSLKLIARRTFDNQSKEGAGPVEIGFMSCIDDALGVLVA